MGMDVSKWFPVNLVLRQDCMMSMVVQCIYGLCGARGECKGACERAGTAEC